MGWIETGVFYHFIHGLALITCGIITPSRASVRSAKLFSAGIALFSGSLYLMALTGLNKLGAVTPIGGLCLIGGWISFCHMAWCLGQENENSTWPSRKHSHSAFTYRGEVCQMPACISQWLHRYHLWYLIWDWFWIPVQLHCRIGHIGTPAACRKIDTNSPQYLARWVRISHWNKRWDESWLCCLPMQSLSNLSWQQLKQLLAEDPQ